MPVLKDQIGHEINFDSPFKRIISLVPSQTELLIDLVGTEKVVGRTKFCIHPRQEIKKIEVIGGTKQFNFEKIDEISPDLIIANKEENYKEGVEKLQEKYPVWTSDIFDLIDNYHMIESIGRLVGQEAKARLIVNQIKESFHRIKGSKEGSVLYFIWQNPYMVAGRNTFVDYLLDYMGFENLCIQKRYPEMDEYILDKMKPDYVLLSSEPYPFKEKHIEKFEKLFPKSKIFLVDGEMFSWYGSHLTKAGAYFETELLNK